jgi:hypothetical protein
MGPDPKNSPNVRAKQYYVASIITDYGRHTNLPQANSSLVKRNWTIAFQT